MATSSVYLSGGPCNGRTVPASDIQGGLVGYIACGGGYYVVDGTRRRPNGDLIFTYSGKTQPGQQSSDAQALKGWRDIRHSINHTMPHALNESERLRRASLRALGHGRKV